MQPGEEVEVEASDGHDRIVGILLVGHQRLTGLVPDEGEAVVICGGDRAGEGSAGCAGTVLDVGVMLGVVGDEVVDVVTALPPADGEAAAKVRDEDPNQGVNEEVSGYGAMVGIVCREYDLVLPKSEVLTASKGWG